MSDPAKNAEVEDVLSSIRRLVSEEKRPLQRLAPEPEPTPDRLVLTPAHRVENDAREDAVEPEPADELADMLSETVDDETRAASRESGYPGDTDDIGDDEAQHVDATSRTDQVGSAQTVPAIDTRLSAKIAALETAIGDIRGDFEPDGALSDENAGIDPPPLDWEDVGDAEPAAQMDSDARRPWPEEAVDNTVEMDAEPDVDHAATPETLAEAVKMPDPSADLDAGTDDSSEVDGFDFIADESVLDEDALRDMISEIVREELQGALGERITRNVRRLVRREIHRALTARDLD